MSRLFDISGVERNVPEHSSWFTCLGATNFGKLIRQENDFYATDPVAVTELLKVETFSNNIWEPACGMGHIAETLKKCGFTVKATDLYDYGYGTPNIDFLTCQERFDGDIITNPPFKYSLEFVRKGISLLTPGHKVAMLLKLQFLEGKERRKLFEQTPPRYVYVATKRINCARDGDFVKYPNNSAVCYAWYIWEKDYFGETILRWFNYD